MIVDCTLPSHLASFLNGPIKFAVASTPLSKALENFTTKPHGNFLTSLKYLSKFLTSLAVCIFTSSSKYTNFFHSSDPFLRVAIYLTRLVPIVTDVCILLNAIVNFIITRIALFSLCTWATMSPKPPVKAVTTFFTAKGAVASNPTNSPSLTIRLAKTINPLPNN